ncbi:hypothetical protein MNBD_GAMMA17-1973 [hydrothermal vent metagenome]|uniref:Uncharacterized protein n=1 Tax=hydrothermal vent metagenome TaxID=652676 RepID=A0A3B0ZG85_9ZZZZ
MAAGSFFMYEKQNDVALITRNMLNEILVAAAIQQLTSRTRR